MPHSRKMHGDILRVGCLKLFRRFEHHQRTTPWTGNNGDDENVEDEPELGLKKLTGTLPVSTLSTLGETPFYEIPCRQNGNKPRNVSASCSNEGKGRMPWSRSGSSRWRGSCCVGGETTPTLPDKAHSRPLEDRARRPA